MSFHCFKCNAEVSLGPDQRVGRRDTCSKCGTDLHVCLNCKFHDRSAYNECRESSAERVLDKDRSNFCDYFSFREGQGTSSKTENDHLKKLDALFKK